MLKTVSAITNAIGALNYKGTWNASTNTPTLASGVGVKGDYYVVSVAGSTSLDGQTLWGVGDWVTFNGSVWQRVDGGSTGNFASLAATSFALSGQSVTTRVATASSPIENWTDTGGANNSYLAFYNSTNAWLYARSKNGTGAIKPIRYSINDYGDSTTGVQLWIENNGSVCAGLSAPATSATGGFFYAPACAGTPTGTPTAQTGYAPIVVDSTNNKLYFYSNGAWRDAGP
jgi:hypothetical protein